METVFVITRRIALAATLLTGLATASAGSAQALRESGWDTPQFNPYLDLESAEHRDRVAEQIRQDIRETLKHQLGLEMAKQRDRVVEQIRQESREALTRMKPPKPVIRPNPTDVLTADKAVWMDKSDAGQ